VSIGPLSVGSVTVGSLDETSAGIDSTDDPLGDSSFPHEESRPTVAIASTAITVR
jgi:hypothetical protein